MARAVLVFSLALAGNLSCLTSQNEFCGVGHVCKAGKVCTFDGLDCVDPAQRLCGNGAVDLGEACDDGNRVGGDDCSEDCRTNYQCGNGIIDNLVDVQEISEACDCGVANAVVQTPEQIADCQGMPNSDTGGYCKTDCTRFCGDGIINNDEDCDSEGPLPSCVDAGYDHGQPMCSTIDCEIDLSSCSRRGFYYETVADSDIRIRAVWGSGTGEVFLVGDSGRFFRHVAHDEWEAVPAGNVDDDLKAVYGSDASNVFALGEEGTILHYDGNLLTVEDGTAGESLVAIWTDGITSLAFAADGRVFSRRPRNDEEQGVPIFTWARQPVSLSVSISDVWLRSSNDIFVVTNTGSIVHFLDNVRDMDSELDDAESYYRAIWGVDDQLIAVGDNGKIVRFIDGAWQQPTVFDPQYDLVSVWGSSPESIFIAGTQGLILRCNQSECKKLNTVPFGEHAGAYVPQAFERIWTGGPTDVFAVASPSEERGHGLWRYDGVEWSFNDPSHINSPIRGVWGRSASVIHALAANGTYATFDGETWAANMLGPELEMPGDEIRGLTGIHDGEVSRLIAVGDRAKVFTFDGAWHEDTSIPLQEPEPRPSFRAVWTSSQTVDDDGDIIVAGESGTLLRKRGINGPWRAMSLVFATQNQSPALTAIWGRTQAAGGYEGWVIGDDGVIYRFDHGDAPATLSLGNEPTTTSLLGLAGTDTTTFAVGHTTSAESVIWLLQETPWRNVDSEKLDGIALHTVWAIDDHNVYAGGEEGAILRYDGFQWSSDSPFDEDTRVTAIWGTQEVVVFGDEAGNLWGLYP